MSTVTNSVKPPRTSIGVIGWLRKNLFSTWYNGILTLVILYLVYTVGRGLVTWVLVQARWEVIPANLRLFMVGQFPPQQLWRVWSCVLFISLLFGLSWAVWGGVIRSFAITIAAAFGTLALLPFSIQARLWLLGNLMALFGGYGIARLLLSRWRERAGRILRYAVLGGWLASFPLTILLLRGFGTIIPPVDSNLWGGLLLTFLLAVVGISLSFPLGVVLALGRRSSLPIIRIASVLYIELIRGVPLVTVLFMADIMLPLFLPEGIHINRILRAMAGFVLFSAAYTAENVRGGLQSVPEGQVEAAKALGLSAALTTSLIVLPQALRAVIPAIVGQFISLFKDTSLVAIMGLLELLGIGKAILAQPEYMGLQREVYVFIAIIYGIFCYAMSYASRRLETALGVGER